ncbi:polysaccharide deacetylase family protein [Streptomyces pathocidini]|uniref:polysaccharide deacetylase family protein n=1 Tax=Streptomyces pathocidini TaxID=1650571 RepID=UPI0033E6F506
MQLVRQAEKTARARRWGITVGAAGALVLIGVVGSAQHSDGSPSESERQEAESALRLTTLGTLRAPVATFALEGRAATVRRVERDTVRDGVPGPGYDPARDAAPAGSSGAAYGVAPEDAFDSAGAQTSAQARAEAARTATAWNWGLARVPLLPPPPPAVKPRLTTAPGLSRGPGLPPVITRVPTQDRVVFLTIDDGAKKDPELLRMLRELDVPVSAFLTDELVRDDYGYYREMRRLGTAIHNHTLSHPNLRRLSAEQQHREICGQQDAIEREFGVRTRIFRPPYGNYDADTLRVAASCGISVVPLWSEEAFPDRMDFGRGDGLLLPGDIILTHFRGRGQWRGEMPDVIRRVVDLATEQGFAVGCLEDYV